MSKIGRVRLIRIAKDAKSVNSDLQNIFPDNYSPKELQNLARRFTSVSFHLEQIAKELTKERRTDA